MGRRWQVFIAPGEEGEELPIPESPWHVSRQARMPSEHWEVIIEFAEKNLPGLGELLESASYFDEDYSGWSSEKTQTMYEGLKQLCILIDKSEPLTPEVSNEIPEDYTNQEHIRMIEAVIAVIEESRKMGEMFDSYIDS